MLPRGDRDALRRAHARVLAAAAEDVEAQRAAAAGEPEARDATFGTHLRLSRARWAFLALIARHRDRCSVAELADVLGMSIATLDTLLAEQAELRAQDRRAARRRWVGAARAARWARVPASRPQAAGRRRRRRL